MQNTYRAGVRGFGGFIGKSAAMLRDALSIRSGESPNPGVPAAGGGELSVDWARLPACGTPCALTSGILSVACDALLRSH
jgi:hypothetical protein